MPGAWRRPLPVGIWEPPTDASEERGVRFTFRFRPAKAAPRIDEATVRLQRAKAPPVFAGAPGVVLWGRLER